MEQNLILKQTQTLSPQQRQSVEILQMSSLELTDYLQELALENPVLEFAAGLGEDPAPAQSSLAQRLEWLTQQDGQNRAYASAARERLGDPLERLGDAGGLEETLERHLLWQLSGQEAPDGPLAAAQFLCLCLDRDGYLRDPLEQLAQAARMPMDHMEAGLLLLQSLEPAGVGAKDLSQCLSLQLERRGETGLALSIAQSQLDHLARGQYGAIAKALGASQEQVHQACEVVRALDPRPGTRFAARERPAYLLPDLEVRVENGQIAVVPSAARIPSLQLNGYYQSLRTQTEDPEVREYLEEKVKQAQWALHAVEQRQSTLLRCAQYIAGRQQAFFTGGGSLAPLKLAEVAQALELHESTVSRAIREKYIQCSRGLYPLRRFLTVSGGQAQDLLRRFVEEEDKTRPLSDQQLCALLEEAGCPTARRTVAKYREELGIPSSPARKQVL